MFAIKYVCDAYVSTQMVLDCVEDGRKTFQILFLIVKLFMVKFIKRKNRLKNNTSLKLAYFEKTIKQMDISEASQINLQ